MTTLPDSRTLTIDAERIVDLASKLIQFPSENPPGNEAEAAAFLADHCRALGMNVEVTEPLPGRPNVVAWVEGRETGPHLIFNGHLDVVPAGANWTTDPFQPVVRDGRIYGRGSADMKGALAATVEAVDAVRRSGTPFRGRITLSFVCDEEEGGTGTRFLVASGLRGDWAIVTEPTELKPVIAHKGDFYFDVTLYGVAAHGSVPHRGVNAIYHAGKLLDAVQEFAGRLAQRSHPLVGNASISTGLIRGGETTNVVPAECLVSLDRRVLPNERPAEVIAEIDELLEDLAARDPTFRYRVENPVRALPMEISADEPVVIALREAATEVLGSDPGVHGWAATCDANLLVNDAQTPTVVFGPGSIDQAAHQADESVAIPDLVSAAEIYAATIVRLLGLEN